MFLTPSNKLIAPIIHLSIKHNKFITKINISVSLFTSSSENMMLAKIFSLNIHYKIGAKKICFPLMPDLFVLGMLLIIFLVFKYQKNKK